MPRSPSVRKLPEKKVTVNQPKEVSARYLSEFQSFVQGRRMLTYDDVSLADWCARCAARSFREGGRWNREGLVWLAYSVYLKQCSTPNRKGFEEFFESFVADAAMTDGKHPHVSPEFALHVWGEMHLDYDHELAAAIALADVRSARKSYGRRRVERFVERFGVAPWATLA